MEKKIYLTVALTVDVEEWQEVYSDYLEEPTETVEKDVAAFVRETLAGSDWEPVKETVVTLIA